MNLSLALGVAVALIAASPAAAAAPRPTALDARASARLVLSTYAEATNGRLVVGTCAPLGQRSYSCKTRIAGPVTQRYTVVTTKVSDGFWIQALLR